MAKVDLTEMDVKNLLNIINGSQIKGEAAETISILKQKLVSVLPKNEPAAPAEGDSKKEPETPVNPAVPVEEKK